jgi:hypothetical protein
VTTGFDLSLEESSKQKEHLRAFVSIKGNFIADIPNLKRGRCVSENLVTEV